MHVIPVPVVLGMERLEPMEVLLDQKRLVPYDSAQHFRKVIFVSHQWLSANHPDPNGDHMRTLKSVLARLMSGKVARVETHWSQMLSSTDATCEAVPAAAWAAALPQMVCCWDFLASPLLAGHDERAAVGAAGGGGEARPGQRPDDDGGDEPPAGASALRALPAFVERAALLLVLAPLCRHADHGQVCGLPTWRGRARGHAEVAACRLARTPVRVLVCTGPEAEPYFLPADEALAWPLGLGDLICCQQGPCGDNCEGSRMRAIIETMLAAKEADLEARGLVDERRAWASLRGYLLRGLADKASSPPSSFAASELRRLRRAAPAAGDGAGGGGDGAGGEAAPGADGEGLEWLLPLAAVANDRQAASDVLAASCCHPDRPKWRGGRVGGARGGASALMLAMRFADFGVSAALLKAAADPGRRVEGWDPLMFAALSGLQGAAVREWLGRFPHWNLEAKEAGLGRTALSLAAGVGPRKAPVVYALLAARASPWLADDSGALPLHAAAAKGDADVETVRALLAAAGDTVNAPLQATGSWRSRYRSARLYARLGMAGTLQRELATWEGRTPLHFALAAGDTAVALVLLEASADPNLRNAQGMTPSQLAGLLFGGDPPEALADVLNPATRASVVGDKISAPSKHLDFRPPDHSPVHVLHLPSFETIPPAATRDPSITSSADSIIAIQTPMCHARQHSLVSPLPPVTTVMRNNASGEFDIDTFGDTIKASDSDGATPKKKARFFSTVTCKVGSLGVTSLTLAEDMLALQTTSFATTMSSPAAIRGDCMTWVRGEELGSGSLGRVFSALDQKTGQLIAVKEVVFEESIPSDLSFKATLEHEISILKHLKHPHIVSYLGNDCINGCLYIYLEHMPGGSLAGVLAQFGPFEESLIAVYTRSLLEGLEYLHTRHPPVIHRDIKGANVLVGLDCKVKLSDFGCSKRSHDTLSKTMKGSIPWMAPEVIQHAGYSRPADVWSLGCVVVEMATATRPWGRFDNVMAAMVKISMSEETPPIPPSLSADCQSFLDSCLRREPLLRLSPADLLTHPFVKELHEAAPERRGAEDYLDSVPDYGTLKELLPNYLD